MCYNNTRIKNTKKRKEKKHVASILSLQTNYFHTITPWTRGQSLNTQLNQHRQNMELIIHLQFLQVPNIGTHEEG